MMNEKAQVLVVEDSRSNSELICSILRATSEITPHQAFTGEEALEFMERARPDLIVLDVIMPGISGFEVCKQLKANPSLRDIPVIFVTARAAVEDVVEGLNMGAVDYVAKPIIPEILEARVRAHLALSFDKEHLKTLANTDALTGLYNRKSFEAFLRDLIEHRSPFALIYLDLDHFKPVNDELGHQAGDQLLQQVAGRLQSTVRLVDFVARIGGDEFVLIINNVKSHPAIEFVIDKLLKILAQPYNLDLSEAEPRQVHISATIGGALYPLDTDNEHELVRYADTAMYHAKELGRNQYYLYGPEIESIISNKRLSEEGIRDGLENDEFELFYLPSVSLSEGTVLSMEVLLRWRHSERGLLAPDEFLETFILSHMEERLFVFVIRKAVLQIKEWHQEGVLDAHLVLNLTHAEFINRRLVQYILQAFELSECDPLLASWLELEVPGSYLVQDIEFSRRQIRQLAEIGVTVSLDHFGSSCISIYDIHSMPLSQVKIDRKLIHDIGSESSERILQTVINMVISLGHNPAAVGVENEQQAAFLKEHGCPHVQGYLFTGVLDKEAAGRVMRGEEKISSAES